MRVSSSLFYDRASTAMSLLSGRADAIQTQIATGKRLAAASDDAAAYSRLRTLAVDGADAKASAANLVTAASVLQQADTTLTGIAAQIQRASELAVRARSGTNDQTALEAIAAELDAIGKTLMGLGNTTDPRGQPLFGGADGSPAVSAGVNGGYVFASTSPGAIPTGDGQSVQPSENAARIFVRGTDNLLSDIDALAAALRTGGTGVDAAASAAIGKLAEASTQALTVQASLGARAARVELQQSALVQAGVDREAVRSGIEDTDITAAITELQKTMTILSATQASFTKLQGLSLFNYLR